MKQMKKVLSVMLALCMILTFVPVSALAEDAAGSSDTGAVMDSTVENEPEEQQDVAEDSAAQPQTSTFSLPSSTAAVNDAAAYSLTMGTKPTDGTTTGNPFVQGTGGSNSFRIPAMVTLDNGTIVAAADARWNTTYDGGGLDTIVSYSANNGDDWNYTFANYLGDNGNTYNGSGSTAFIDPALATDGKTVYMLCDLYPYGVALNGSGNTAPSKDVGFNDDGTLKLAASGSSTYNYYLKDGQIYDSGNNVVSGYTVDAYFNITGNGYDTNLFFSDSPYQVVRTGYLYLTKSTDRGKTWSEPTLIPNVKTSSEQVCLVGPGRGLVTGGKIIFPVYSYDGSAGSQQMGFIYSSDDGATWSRSANFTGASWSSEAAVVALSDGTLRFFYRNGTSRLCYVDYSWETGSWGSAVNTGIATNSNTQISAISYSKTVDGKQVILVSCPTGSNNTGSADSSASARLNGKIFVGYVNSDQTMSWQSDKTISVTSGNSPFMYSCLTELANGEVAILYENQESAWGTGDNCYYTMAFQTYDLGLTGDETEQKPEENPSSIIEDMNTGVAVDFGDAAVTTMTVEKVTISALADQTYVAYNVTPSGYTGSATVTIPLEDELNGSKDLRGFVVESDGSVTYIPGEHDASKKTYTFTTPHFSALGVTAVLDRVAQSEGSTPDSYVLDTDGIDRDEEYLIVYQESANATSGLALNTSKGSTAVTISDSKATPSGDAASARWQITSYYSYYYVTNGNSYLYPSRAWSYPSGLTYSLNVGTSATLVSISRSGSTYSISSSKSYVNYSNGWGASDNSQSFYLYKYTPGTQSWTVDPALQAQRIEELTVVNDGYTDETWNSYQTALENAKKQLENVQSSTYNSDNDANTALNKLTKLVNNLESAKNSLVQQVTITIHYTFNGNTVYTETHQIAASTTTITLPGSVTGADGTTYSVSNTTLAVTPLTVVEYNVPVTEYTGTPISIKENETTTISVDLGNGQTVEWSSADSNYVGVAGKYDTSARAYTNEAILAGQNVTDSPVTVTATIKDADGNVVRTEKWLVTVTEGDADTNTSSKGIYFNIDTIEHCTVYYSINGGELIPVNGTGVTTGNWTGNGTYKGHFNIMFFAAPDEGYALTYMSISGSDDQYYTLTNGNPDGTGSDAWPFNSANASTIPSDSNDSAWKTVNGLHGFRWALLEGNMTIDQMKVLFSNAIALGCDGATTITKNKNDGMGSARNPTVCKFVAQKLPTVAKTIKSITHGGTETSYKDGMKVEIGDTIKYSVVVTRYATNSTYGTITYDNEKLTDKLTQNDGISNPNMGTSTTSKTYSYTTSLTLTTDNFADVVKDGKIVNTADFSYSYSSKYSSGSLTSEASAVADITVEIPSYVIDFGLPVELNLEELVTAYGAITQASATFGDAAVNGATVTYTPNKVLTGVDYITLTLGNGGTYQIAVYPATTVYYEEGFATYTVNWTDTGSTGTGTQAAQVAGKSRNEYGYDAAYNSVGASNGTEATSNTKGDCAVFTFTGNGLDIYANTSASSGNLTIQFFKVEGNTKTLKNLYMVDTHMQNGEGSVTNGQAVDAYNVPVVTWSGDYGTYEVKIYHSVNNNTVALDGFRVYNTLEKEPDFYTTDQEDKPTYIELRDAILDGYQVSGSNNQTHTSTVGAIVSYDRNSDTYSQLSKETVTDLLNNGPKNELYLRSGESVSFKVKTDRVVQIGLKALNAGTSYTISGTNVTDNGSTKFLSTSTDMFYTVLGKSTTEESRDEQTITITNKGEGILSITKIKVCDDPNATLLPLTEEDINAVVARLNGGSSGQTPSPDPEPQPVCADAKLTVSVICGGKTASAELTANGVVGETATFTAADVEKAAQSLVAKGYQLTGVSYTNVEVKYGDEATVTFTARKQQTIPAPTPGNPGRLQNALQNIWNGIQNIFNRVSARR